MKKKKLLLPILLLAPAFLASQVAADEQTAPETSLEAAQMLRMLRLLLQQKPVLLLPKVLQRVQLSCLKQISYIPTMFMVGSSKKRV